MWTKPYVGFLIAFVLLAGVIWAVNHASKRAGSPAPAAPTADTHGEPAIAQSALPTGVPVATAAPSASIAPTVASPLPGGACHARLVAGASALAVLPDPACTPGAANSAVTQANIGSTICVSGWTKTIRPPASVTGKLKADSMAAYGFTDSISAHEEDHLISLELGGAPADVRNLWAEPGAAPNPKDKVEDALHALVCSGKIQLADAQAAIATDWVAAYRTYVGGSP